MNNKTSTTAANLETLRSLAPRRDPVTMLPVAHSLPISAQPGLDAAVDAVVLAHLGGDDRQIHGALIRTQYELANQSVSQAQAQTEVISRREADLEGQYGDAKAVLEADTSALEQRLEGLQAVEDAQLDVLLAGPKLYQRAALEAEIARDEAQRARRGELVLEQPAVVENTQAALESAQGKLATALAAAGVTLGEQPTEISERFKAGLGAQVDALVDHPASPVSAYAAKFAAVVFTTANLGLVFVHGRADELDQLAPGLWVASAALALVFGFGSQAITTAAHLSSSAIQRFEVMQRVRGGEIGITRWYCTPSLLTAWGASAALALLESAIGYLGLGAALRDADIICSNTPGCTPTPPILIFAASSVVGSVLTMASYNYGRVSGVNHANRAGRVHLEWLEHVRLAADPLRQAVIGAELALAHTLEQRTARRADHQALLEQFGQSLLELGASLQRDAAVLEELSRAPRVVIEGQRQRLAGEITAVKSDLERLRHAHAEGLSVLETHVEALMGTAEVYGQKLERLLSSAPGNFSPAPPVSPNAQRGLLQRLRDWLSRPVRGPRLKSPRASQGVQR